MLAKTLGVSVHLALQRFVSLPLFASLHSRPFRWYWLGRIAASATMQMGTVAQGWLVYHLTGSGLALSMVSSAGGFATLIISPFGGVYSDRVDKRTLLVLARAAWCCGARSGGADANRGHPDLAHRGPVA